MQGKNRYFRRSHLSEAKFRRVVPYFAHDLPTSKIAEPNDARRPTIKQFLFKLRTRIAHLCDVSSPFSGEVEVDESYFGGRRVCGKKGYGAGGKMIVFGILERHGKIHTEIIPNAAKKPTQATIRGPVALEASPTRTAGAATMDWWIGGTKSLSVRIMVSMNLPVIIALSMALNHSGHMPNEGLQIQWCSTKNFSSIERM